MSFLNSCFKSKTMWFASGLSVLGVVQANMGLLTQHLTPESAGWATMGVGVVVAVLRTVTTNSLGEK
jgi:hypothetical protein